MIRALVLGCLVAAGALLPCGCASRVQTVRFTRLADGVWLHTSDRDLPGVGPFPSNGLVVRIGHEALLIDTAWNDDQTRQIVRWAERTLRAPIRAAIVTHAHDDKMGGVAALHAEGVATSALARTNELAPSRGLVPAARSLRFVDDVEPLAGGALEAFYPGPGHSVDNVVIYVRSADLVFGGCLVRPAGATSLGNVADADVERWDGALARVRARYPTARIVVPSHGRPGGPELLSSSIDLVAAHRRKRLDGPPGPR